ncbi:MAG: hypothetical protein FWH55_10805 [Oscillospiraceae bacterium]|nr:hypothetical protein [Oscillospiraceae bacterium]
MSQFDTFTVYQSLTTQSAQFGTSLINKPPEFSIPQLNTSTEGQPLMASTAQPNTITVSQTPELSAPQPNTTTAGADSTTTEVVDFITIVGANSTTTASQIPFIAEESEFSVGTNFTGGSYSGESHTNVNLVSESYSGESHTNVNLVSESYSGESHTNVNLVNESYSGESRANANPVSKSFGDTNSTGESFGSATSSNESRNGESHASVNPVNESFGGSNSTSGSFSGESHASVNPVSESYGATNSTGESYSSTNSTGESFGGDNSTNESHNSDSHVNINPVGDSFSGTNSTGDSFGGTNSTGESYGGVNSTNEFHNSDSHVNVNPVDDSFSGTNSTGDSFSGTNSTGESYSSTNSAGDSSGSTSSTGDSFSGTNSTGESYSGRSNAGANTASEPSLATDDVSRVDSALESAGVPTTRATVYNIYLVSSSLRNLVAATGSNYFVDAGSYLLSKGLPLEDTPVVTLASLLNKSIDYMERVHSAYAATRPTITNSARSGIITNNNNYRSFSTIEKGSSSSSSSSNSNGSKGSDSNAKSTSNVTKSGGANGGSALEAHRQISQKAISKAIENNALHGKAEKFAQNARIQALRQGKSGAADDASKLRAQLIADRDLLNHTRQYREDYRNHNKNIAAMRELEIGKDILGDNDLRNKNNSSSDSTGNSMHASISNSLSDGASAHQANANRGELINSANSAARQAEEAKQAGQAGHMMQTGQSGQTDYAIQSSQSYLTGESGGAPGAGGDTSYAGAGAYASGSPAIENVFSKILSSISMLKDVSIGQLASMFKSGLSSNLSEMAAAKQVIDHSSSIGKGIDRLEAIVSSYVSGGATSTIPQDSLNSLFRSYIGLQQQSSADYFQSSAPYVSSEALVAQQAEIVWNSPFGKRILKDVSDIKKIIPRADLKALKEGVSISDIYNELKSRLRGIEAKMTRLGVKPGDPVSEALSSVKGNIKAQEQLCKNQICFQIPIMYNQKPSSLNVYVFDKRKTGKGANAEGGFSIFLNLETESLGTLGIDITVSESSNASSTASSNTSNKVSSKPLRKASGNTSDNATGTISSNISSTISSNTSSTISSNTSSNESGKARNNSMNVYGAAESTQSLTRIVDLEITVRDRTVKRYLDSFKGTLGERINDAGFKIGTIVCGIKLDNAIKPEYKSDGVEKEPRYGVLRSGAKRFPQNGKSNYSGMDIRA